ncbi:MAG: TIGR03668 family PPOX class F420-dependent oxidoreductase [Chloroflexota bacterium]|nr:TIGR03668 family PPOX class F420-dependent oxidoreductase [Chloroflexota bacterium]
MDDTLRAFIDTRRVARLATADAHGRPHVVPVCFALLGDTLYTPVDEKPKRAAPAGLRRVRNIAREPRVQVLVDVYDDADWSNLRYVQLRGRARIIEAGGEHTRALAALRARYPQYRAMALESRPVIAVDIDRAVHWRAR